MMICLTLLSHIGDTTGEKDKRFFEIHLITTYEIPIMINSPFMPYFRDKSQLQDHQLSSLQWTVAHAYNGSEFYKKLFQTAGITPGDIQSLSDLSLLPFTTSEDLKNDYPLSFLSVAERDVVRVHASSGTTGKRKILPYTQTDIDTWVDMMARCYEMAGVTENDRVQIAVGYGLWTAGMGFQLGCERLGATAIPVGPGNIDIHCQFLIDMQSTIFCSTASMALLMAEEVTKRGIQDQINLRTVIFGAERSSSSMRDEIKNQLGLDDVFDITGMTELYGPGAGIDCPNHEGIHYWADKYLLEILDPETSHPVADGEIGEMVITSLCKEAAPLIRYRTGDLTRAITTPCSCGNILPMHDKILGRTDDMVILRGVNIYPGQIDDIISSFAELGSEYQLHIERKDDCKDYMTIKVEAQHDLDDSQRKNLAKNMSKKTASKIMVHCNIDICDFGEMTRSAGKSKRIFDTRYDS